MSRSRPRLLAGLVRATVLAGLTAAALGVPAVAQAPAALDDVFADLRQLQDANLGIARQMSDIQREAAAVLEAADGGADAAQREVVEALVANALTLASVVLAPVTAQEVATGAMFFTLLEQNLALVTEVEPLFGDEAGLAEALELYAVMQLQSQDLGLALRNGWARYAEALVQAGAAGLLPADAFDPAGRTWTIRLPAVEVASTAAADEERLQPQFSALEQSIVETAPHEDMAAALAREAERLAAVAPEAAGVAVPAIEAIAPERPAPGGATVAAVSIPAAQPAAWMVMIGDNARAVAKAPNTNTVTLDRIRGLQIGCHPNGTLRYIFETDREVGEYLVFANSGQHAAIRASNNVVSGSEAIHMSDVLRLAFEWATGTADPHAHIMVAAGDDPEALAYFPVSGYLDARGRVLDGCLPWQEDPARAAPREVVVPEPKAPAQPVEAAKVETEAVRPVDTIAPVPRPRPTSRMPIDLMNAG